MSRQMIRSVLRRMLSCHDNFKIYRRSSGLGESVDSGRRNSILSEAPEKYLAEALQERFPLAFADGRTGEHDVIIPELNNHYIECKLTSKSDLQVDVDTLRSKQPLDHIFFIVNDDFDSFVVLYFKGLTVDDFHEPSENSKGKSSMIKHRAMERCDVLYGNVIEENKRHIANIKLETIATEQRYERAVQRTMNRKSNRANIHETLQNHEKRLNRRLEILKKRKQYWSDEPMEYSLLFEPIWDDSLEFETTITFSES